MIWKFRTKCIVFLATLLMGATLQAQTRSECTLTVAEWGEALAALKVDLALADAGEGSALFPDEPDLKAASTNVIREILHADAGGGQGVSEAASILILMGLTANDEFQKFEECKGSAFKWEQVQMCTLRILELWKNDNARYHQILREGGSEKRAVLYHPRMRECRWFPED